jgi:hypothetical protein
MTLWLRRSGLVSPADADRADYLVIEHEKVIGRIYEQRYVPADVRWFRSITAFHVDPALGIDTNGRVPTLDEAKAQFRSSWNRVCEQQSMPDRLVSRTTVGANE